MSPSIRTAIAFAPQGRRWHGKAVTDEGDLRGCIRCRRAAGDSGPYGRGSSHSVGAAISRPPSQSRLRRASSPTGGAKDAFSEAVLTCLPLWGRCPVRTLGGEGCGLPQLIPPNSYFLTYFLGTSTWVPPM